jgi:hypothetical protein
VQVNIKGKTVTSAAYEHLAGKMPILIINQRGDESWVCTQSGYRFLTFYYKYKTHVELIAENDSEAEVLSRIRFESHCKDQKLILFVSDDLI